MALEGLGGIAWRLSFSFFLRCFVRAQGCNCYENCISLAVLVKYKLILSRVIMLLALRAF
jgi:hypothetical protein